MKTLFLPICLLIFISCSTDEDLLVDLTQATRLAGTKWELMSMDYGQGDEQYAPGTHIYFHFVDDKKLVVISKFDTTLIKEAMDRVEEIEYRLKKGVIFTKPTVPYYASVHRWYKIEELSEKKLILNIELDIDYILSGHRRYPGLYKFERVN